MRRAVLVIGALVLFSLQPIGAQAPGAVPAAQPVAPNAATASKLPVRRVILYKNGVGYFEHFGKVHGNETVTIDFNSSQLNDVLKSLTTLDLGNGRVTSIAYNSEAPLTERLGALRLPVGEHTTLAQLLDALRGARLEVHAGTGIITGRLLSVERIMRGSGPDARSVDQMTLVSDAGDVRVVEITPAVQIRLAERDTNQQVGTYLGVLASTRAQDRRRMTITTAGSGERDLLVSYISEVPIWKTTYRIVLPSRAGAKPILQGWAIVDNTIGEDWQNIELSLVAGAPQSFIQQISQPLYLQRPVVPLPSGVLVTPQTHGATLQTGTEGISGTVADSSGAPLPGAIVAAMDASGRTVAQTVTNSQGAYALTSVPPGRYAVVVSLSGFQTRRFDVTVEPGLSTEQNAQLGIGSVAETVTVTGRSFRSGVSGGAAGGIVGGLAAAPALVAPPRQEIEAKLDTLQAAAQGRELGDLFEYKIGEPITIAKNQSALVPILRSEVSADHVSLWNGTTPGGRPLRSLWLTNASGLTLDGGSFTILDGGAFAGEGLMEPLKPTEKRLLSYAVDLGILVEPRNGDERRTVTRVTISRGVLVQHGDHLVRRAYTIRNSDTTDRQVVIEHPIRAGWKLAADGPKPVETSADAYRFSVTVAGGKTEVLTVVERQDLGTTYRVADINDQQLAVIVRDSGNSQAVHDAIAPVFAKKAALATIVSDINARNTEMTAINNDQQRVRENMKALKGTPEEQQLTKRYATELSQQEDRVQAIRKDLEDLQQKRRAAEADLARAIDALNLDVAVTGR